MKLFKKIAVVAVLILLLFVGSLPLLFKIPKVQSFVLKKAHTIVRQNLNLDITITSIDYELFSYLELNGVLLRDDFADTLLYCPKFSFNLLGIYWGKSTLDIGNVQVQNPFIRLVYNDSTQLYNFEQVLQVFASSDTSKSNLDLRISSIELNQYNIQLTGLPLGAMDTILGKDINITKGVLVLEDLHFFDSKVDLSVTKLDFDVNNILSIHEAKIISLAYAGGKLDVPVFEGYLNQSFWRAKAQMKFGKPDTTRQGIPIYFYPGSELFVDLHSEDLLKLGFITEKIFDRATLDLAFEGNREAFTLKKLNCSVDDYFKLNATANVKTIKQNIDYNLFITQFSFNPFSKKWENSAGIISKTQKQLLAFLRDVGKTKGYGAIYGNTRFIDCDISLKNKLGDINFRPRVDFNDAGAFIHGRLVGDNTQKGYIHQQYNLGIKNFNVVIEGLWKETLEEWKVDGYLRGLNYYGNTIENINISSQGNHHKQDLNALVGISDPKMNLEITSTSNIDYLGYDAWNFELNLKKLKPQLYDSSFRNFGEDLRGSMLASLRKTKNQLNAELAFNELTFFKEDKVLNFSKTNIALALDDDLGIQFFMNSPFFTFNFNTSVGLKDFAENHQNINIMDALFSQKKFFNSLNKQDVLAQLKVFEIDSLAHFYDLKLGFEDTLRLGLEVQKDVFSQISADVQHLTFMDKKVKMLKLNTELDSNCLQSSVQLYDVALTDRMLISDFGLFVNRNDDKLDYKIHWHNNDTIEYSGDLLGDLQFDKNAINMSFQKTRLTIADSLWQSNKVGKLSIDSNSLEINEFSLSSGNQFIKVFGSMQSNQKNSLEVQISNFSLGNIMPFISSSDVRLNGDINGKVSIINPLNQPYANANFMLNNLELNEVKIGELSAESFWDPSRKLIKINGKLTNNGFENALVTGIINPYDLKDQMDLRVIFSHFSVAGAEPLLSKWVSEMNGNINGYAGLKGSFLKPSLTGAITFKDLSMRVNYLNTTYRVEDSKIEFLPEYIGFDRLKIFDVNDQMAYANLSIMHDGFSDINYDVFIDVPERFQCLDTRENMNSSYYGTVFLESGQVSISGYDKIVELNVSGSTGNGSTINIPLSNPYEIVDSDFITFESNDSIVNMSVNDRFKSKVEGLKLNMDLHVNNNLETRIIFDEKVGDVIRTRGEGDIEMKVLSGGSFKMYGDYFMSEGDYLFTFQNLINKKFEIKPGSSLAWNGDPFDAQLDLDAYYKTKASTSDLIPPKDSSSIGKRVPVLCVLSKYGRLNDQEFGYNITLPTVDSDVSSVIKTLLSKEDEMRRQFFSLLVLNRFLPVNEGGAFRANALAARSSTEVFSNQLSNLLSGLSDDFDLGVDYRPGDELSADELDLALSTQFFNDRLVFEGNLGYTGQNGLETADQSTSHLVGDVLVEYKLNRKGNVLLKAYNKSNDNNVFTASNSLYTQGVGVGLKKEFDGFSDLINSLFKRNKSKK